MLERDIRLVALTGGRYHAASLTCIELLEILKRAKDAGLKVSASASINHITLNENDIGPYRTYLKLSPPLRTEADRAALAAAVSSGLIDTVMSDHNPQDVETKRLPFAEAEAGAIGLETMLPAGLRLVHNGELTLKALIRSMSTRPGGAARSAGRNVAPRCAGGSGGDRSRYAVGGRSCKIAVILQEYTVRRSEIHGRRGAHDRRRTHCLPARQCPKLWPDVVDSDLPGRNAAPC